MSYIDNPYNSDTGKNLLKKNLHNIYMTGEVDNTFESEDKDLMVSNFRRRTNTIITIMKRFAKGYKQINLGSAYDSGIYVCPNRDCRRRDFIYSWESVDMGIYSPKDWLGTVKLIKGRSGLPRFGQGKFVVMHRVRCNTVSTCNKCHTTFQGKRTQCLNSSCNGGDEYMVTVGCGEEACAMHYIGEKTLDQQYPTNELTAGRGEWSNRQVKIWKHGGFGGGRMTETRGSEKAFELIQPDSSPLSGRPASLTEVARATPTMRITYGVEGHTAAMNYPLSLYRFGFSQVRKRFCIGRIEGNGLPAHSSRVWLTNDNGSEAAACPVCDAMEPPTVLESRTLIPPRSLLIENPQPLSRRDLIGSHQGGHIWQIYVSDPNDSRERSNFLVPVAQTWNLQTIPREVTSGEIGIGRETCPNDVGFGAEVDEMKKQQGAQTSNIVDYLMLPRARIINLDGSEDVYAAAKKEKALPSVLSKKWDGYVVAIKSETSAGKVVVGGIETAEDGNQDWELTLNKDNLKKFSSGLGESGPGFTFAVCEGRSKAAFEWDGNWVDCSPPCVSFRNQDGTTRKTVRRYPRFNQYPNWYQEAFEGDEWRRAQRNLIRQSGYEPPDASGFEVGKSYLWMDELSHLIMDPLRYGPIMEKAVSNLQTYHSIYAIAEELDVAVMTKTVINECRTCKGAYQAGGIEKSRKTQGYVDGAGKVLLPFIYSQEVFELEMEYQKQFGMNQIDKPIAWGVGGSSAPHDGKALLSNPTQIRID